MIISCRYLHAETLLFRLCEQISRMSGATVATRGRYLSEDELTRAEPGYVERLISTAVVTVNLKYISFFVAFNIHDLHSKYNQIVI